MIADSKTKVGDEHHHEIMCIPYFFGNGFTYFGVKSEQEGVLQAPIFKAEEGAQKQQDLATEILSMEDDSPGQNVPLYKVGKITVHVHPYQQREITVYVRYLDRADINSTPKPKKGGFVWVHTREICGRMSPLDVKMVSTIVSCVGRRIGGEIMVRPEGTVTESHFRVSANTINFLRRRVVPEML